MPMNNRTYDLLKWTALVFLPALAVFIQGLGDIYLLTWTQSFVQATNLFAVFLGAILQISSHHYQGGSGGSALVI